MFEIQSNPAALTGNRSVYGRADALGQDRAEALKVSSQAPESDSVELSDAARHFKPEDSQAQAKVLSIRSEIAKGTYVTKDKLDSVVDKLHEVLFGVAV